MRFRVGEKVVYVGVRLTIWEQIKRAIHPYQVPDKSAVYTVGNTFDVGDEQAIELLEFPSPATAYWCAGFCADAFRRAVRRETDIGIFREILRKATHKRSVDA